MRKREGRMAGERLDTVERRMDRRNEDLDLEGLFGALFSEEGTRDPYPLFRRYHGPGTTHRFAMEVLHDRRFRNRSMEPSDHPMWTSFRRWLIAIDGEEHARIRALA